MELSDPCTGMNFIIYFKKMEMLLWIYAWRLRVMFLDRISSQSAAGQDGSLEESWETGSDVQGCRSLPPFNIRIELSAFCARQKKKKKIPTEPVYVLIITLLREKAAGEQTGELTATDTQACMCSSGHIATDLQCDSVCCLFVPQNNRFTAGSVL